MPGLHLRLYDKGEGRVSLAIGPDGTPNLTFHDKTGTVAYQVSSKGAADLSPNWVLWGYLPMGERDKLEPIAVGAGLTKSECEQRLTTTDPKKAFVICLPDNINPRGGR